MRIRKDLDVYISAEEVVEATGSGSWEHFVIFLGVLKKIKKTYQYNLTLHEGYLEDFLSGKRHSDNSLIKYQRNCIKALKKMIQAIIKIEDKIPKMLRGVEDYHNERGWKDGYPWNEETK